MNTKKEMKTKIELTTVLAVLFLAGFTVVASAQPELHYGNVSPPEGVAVDLFRYTVTYYNPSGEPIEYFKEPVPFLSPGFDDEHPRKAVDSNGDVHIVWMNKSTTGGNWEIYYKEMDCSGTTKVTAKRISDNTIDSMYPSIALDSMNDAHVVWADKRCGTWEIFYSKIQDNTGTDLTIPDVRISLIGGTDSGRVVADPVDGENARFIEHPDIDVDSNDNIHIVWSDSRDGQWEVYYQKQNNNAIPDAPNVSIQDARISNTPSDSQCPVIAVGPDDQIHIAWQDDRDGNWEIYYQRQSNNGVVVPRCNDKCITRSDGYNSAKPDIDVDTSGYAHIVFMDDRPGDPGLPASYHIDRYWEIYTTTLCPGCGNTEGYGVPKRQSDQNNPATVYGVYTGPPDGYSTYPRIVSVGSFKEGYKRITWHDNRDGNWEIYYSDMHNWCNNPNTDIRVTNDNSRDMYPDIAVDANGRPNIKWQNDRSCDWDIFTADYNDFNYVRVTVDEGTSNEVIYGMYPIDPADTNATDGITYVWGMPLQPGNHTYRFMASDGILNATEDIDTHEGPVVHPDEIPPIPEIIEPQDGAVVRGTISIVEISNATDVVSNLFEYSNDNISWTEIGIDYERIDGWSVTWDTTTVGDGAYFIRATMTDYAGNNGSDSIEVNVCQKEVTTVTVNAPAYVEEGEIFDVTIDVDSIADFNAGQFDLSFDSSVVNVTDVVDGSLDGETIPVDRWEFVNEDTLRVILDVSGIAGVNGSGNLATISFEVVGMGGDRSVLDIFNGMLVNTEAEEIPAVWVNDKVIVGPVKVEVNAPEMAKAGETFVASVDVGSIADFNAGLFDLSFDSSVVSVTEVANGSLNGETIPVDKWERMDNDTIRVFIDVPGITGVSGTGNLAAISFEVVGMGGDRSVLGISDGMLVNTEAEEIPAEWIDDKVIVGPVKVEVNAPEMAKSAGTFVANIDVDSIADFNTGLFDLSFDARVVNVTDVADGSVDGEAIPVEKWVRWDDTIRVFLNVPGTEGRSGTGNLAKISFEVVGKSGDESALDISDVILANNKAEEIPAEPIGCLFTVSPVTVKVNAPGEVNAGETFVASIDVDSIADFNSGKFDLSFNSSVVNAVDVAAGNLSDKAEMWVMDEDTISVTLEVRGIGSKSGSGNLATINFRVVGKSGDKSALDISNGMLVDTDAEEIPAVWIDDEITLR